jgi:O-antigen/teichoic acid export membrane protein
MNPTPGGIKDKAFSAVRWTTVATVTGVGMKLVQVVILTHILTPADYGVMAIVAAVLTFPWIINDTGLNSAFIHRRDVTESERSSLFWAGIIFAVLLGVVVLALSPLIAWTYGDPRLLPLLALSAGTFLIVGIGAQYKQNAEKQLLFRPMAIIETIAGLGGTAVAIFTAMAGAGPYTLVWSSLARSAINTVLSWMYLSSDWRPTWHFSWQELRPYLRFGLSAVSSSIISNVNNTLDVIVLGKFVPAVSLGLYSVPRNFVTLVQQLIINLISRVSFPLIASVQHDQSRVRTITFATLNMVGALNAPLYVGMAIFSVPLVRVLFGAEWHGTGPLLAIMAVTGYARAMISPTRGLILGVGLARLELKMSLGILALTLPAMIIGSMQGVMALALWMAGVSVLLLPPVWYGVYRPLAGIGLTSFAVLILRPVLLSVLCMIPGMFLTRELHQPFLQLVVAVLTAAPLYLLLNLLANRPFVDSIFHLLLMRRAPGGARS